MPARRLLGFVASLLLCGAFPVAAQGQGGAVTPARKADYPALVRRQKQLYRQLKSAALRLDRWCGAKAYLEGRREALRVALRLGGRDLTLAGTSKRLEKLHAQANGKAPPVPKGYAAERAKLAQAAVPLYALWREARRGGSLSLATEIAQDLLAADPGHAPTRRALGYERYAERWVGPRAKKLLAQGFVNDPRFGWVKKEDAAKYHQGRRPLDGKFVSQAEADAAHRGKNKPYKIISEHFQVFSCRPLEEGVRFAREAEVLFESWSHLFATFLDAPKGAEKIPGVARQPRLPMRIFYLNDRAQYESATGFKAGKGHFDVGRRCSFFYPYGPKQTRVQMMIFYHEVGHQLFHAFGRGRGRGLGFFRAMRGGNNFLVEGLATYLEGLENVGGKLVPARLDLSMRSFLSSAGIGSNRLAVIGPLRIKLAAQYVRRKVIEPLPTLLALNHGTFPRVARPGRQPLDRYSEAGAFVYFCLHGAEMKYRDRFPRFARAFYAGKALQANAIESYLGVKVAELEKEYHAFLAGIPALR